MSAINTYKPDYAVHPGEILEETLDARNITKVDFAQRCDITPKTVSLIVGGKAPVTPEMSIQFERVLGVSSNIWNNLNATWEMAQARSEAELELSRLHEWARCFPVTEMAKRHWIDKPVSISESVEALLSFFGVASPHAWKAGFGELQVAYRKSPSFDSNPYAVTAWLRRGELMAENINTQPYDAKEFAQALVDIRELTTKNPPVFEPAMKELCASAGVAVVMEGELKGTRLSGAARWLAKDKAIIQLSLRHKTNDHFWFSFFHEAAHILKHAKRQLYLDDLRSGNTDYEEEADKIASEFLIPEDDYDEFCKSSLCFTETEIKTFARKQGIASGIVLGRLQHDKHVAYNSRLNRTLKRHFQLIED